jgi:hypothetical protein
MRRLLAKSALLLVLIAAVEGAIVLCPIAKTVLNHPYLNAWGPKHARLVAPGDNRIILAGGSNVAFGVDSSRLEALASRPAINLGLHGGLGLALMVHELQDQARPGDLVILIPEYEQFYGDTMNGDTEAAELLQHHWSALPYFSLWRQWRNLAVSTQVLASAATFALIDRAKMRLLGRHEPKEGFSVYRNDAFDEHGDMVGHLNQQPKADQVAKGFERISGGFNQRAVSVIARCAEVLSAQGVTFVMLYPSVATGFWDLNQDLAEQVAESIQPTLTVTEPQDWVFPNDWFYDTPYHLAALGREIRTDHLARVIQELPAPRSASATESH